MADIYIFFEEGIKSYIEQSFSKYSKNEEIIFKRSFDNEFLRPLFLNDISLYKNLIQKNKLKSEIWGLIENLHDQNIKQILQKYNAFLDKKKNKLLKYTELKKKSNETIKIYQKKYKEIEEEINNNVQTNNCNDNEDEINIEEKEDLSDVKCKEYVRNNNELLLNKIMKYNKIMEDENKNLEKYENELKRREKYFMIAEINILKLKILTISTYILIDDISNQKVFNKDHNIEDNYKLLNNFITDFIDKCEKIKDITYIKYYEFVRVYVIELVKIINLQGYKDINKKFLNQLLNTIKQVKKTYSTSYISDLIKTIEKLISSPDSFMCPNAFNILKEASFKKIKPRSRNNSFDKNDLTNNNANIKNENNRKIDEFIEKKSDSEDDEEDFQKKLSNVISFKNSSIQNKNNSNIIQNNYNININFQSQSSLGLGDINKYKSYPNDSAFSNNSLIYLEHPNGTNLLNSSKISLDDSISLPGIYRSGSCSELLGINSRLVSQLPSVRNTKQEIDKNNLEFKRKIKMKKENIQKKGSNKKLDKIFGEEIRKIVNNNFYNNENDYNKDKNTTATETKKNKISDEKNENKKLDSNILVVKTPIKAANEDLQEKEEINDKNLMEDPGIKKNLNFLFNQQTDKY